MARRKATGTEVTANSRVSRGAADEATTGRARDAARAQLLDRSGVSSGFISDAETLGIVVSLVVSGTMLTIEFASAFVALGLLAHWAPLVVAPELALTWIVTRRLQQPGASASQRRQEELEHMTRSLNLELGELDDKDAPSRLRESMDRLLHAETRVGWLQAHLLAVRVFWGFDGAVDLSLGLNNVRGAVARCYELIDAGPS